MLKTNFIISDEHPSLAGHFPGYPIVPGVVILDYVSQALLDLTSARYVSEIKSVKFIRPILPLDEVEVTYTLKSLNTYQFKCSINDDFVVAGQVVVAI